MIGLQSWTIEQDAERIEREPTRIQKRIGDSLKNRVGSLSRERPRGVNKEEC